MVSALLDGSKTQTRRVVNEQPTQLRECGHQPSAPWLGEDGLWRWMWGVTTSDDYAQRCPYGVPGDRLWVRETWSAQFDYPLDYRGNRMAWYHQTPAAWRLGSNAMRTYYRADRSMYDVRDYGEQGIDLIRHRSHGAAPKWAPAIHLPRWASRLTLTITDVRVERLQDISEEDARAEGVARAAFPEDCTDEDGILNAECGYFPPRSFSGGYMRTWDSINGKRAPWSSNPWVWVIAFERVSQELPHA